MDLNRSRLARLGIVPAAVVGLSLATASPGNANTLVSPVSTSVSHTVNTVGLTGEAPGGNGSRGRVAEPAPGTFTATAAMNSAHYYGVALGLNSGRVLVAGGQIGGGVTPTKAQLFNPVSGLFEAAGSMRVPRQHPAAAVLADGRVLFAGGSSAGSTATAELYDPATNAFTLTGSLPEARTGATAATLPSGKVLVAGGSTLGSSGVDRAAYLFDPATGTFTRTQGGLHQSGYLPVPAVLSNGKVLVIGSGSAELYNPSTDTFQLTDPMGIPRNQAVSALLPNGQVLVAGGHDGTSSVRSAELYDPVSESFLPTGDMTTPRMNATATVLSDGQVLIAGGRGTASAGPTAEIFNPATGQFTATGPLTTARQDALSAALPGGHVLIAGGYGTSGFLTSAEVFTSPTAPDVQTANASPSSATEWSLHGTVTPNGAQTAATFRYGTDPQLETGTVVAALETPIPAGAESTAVSRTVTGLRGGTTYYFQTVADNGFGGPRAGPIVEFTTPKTVPTAPSGVVGVPGAGTVSVSWVAPGDDGGAPITGYTVTATPGGATCTTAGATTCVVSGLANGVGYRFTVTATNTVGVSTSSTPSPTVTPRTAAGPPRQLVATFGNESATVGFLAPADNGGAPVVNYEYSTDNGLSWSPRTPRSTASPLRITGLVNATTYQVRLRAVTAAGPGMASAPVEVTPKTVPTPPTGVVGVPGPSTVSVSWVAPGDDGGAPVTGYTVTAAPGGGTCTTAGATTCVVSGLANGVGYRFTVTATNTVGVSTSSTPSPTVTPRTAAGPPRQLVATFGNESATVGFLAPADNGGAPVVNYEYSTDNGLTWSPRTPASTASPLRITGLVNATTYQVRLRAVTAAGPGMASAPVEVTPKTVPTPPTGVVGVPGPSTVSVSWVAPADDGGAPVTGYTVTATPGGGTCTTAGATTCVVSGLANGTGYRFTVTATNTVGTSTPSTPSATVTPFTVPGAPRSVAATPADAGATVTWTAPSSDGFSPIVDYVVTSPQAPGRTWMATGDQTTVAVDGLTNGVSYQFLVAARNAAGLGSLSEPSLPVVPQTRPAPPARVYAAGGYASATISWSSADSGGSPVTRYEVRTVGGPLQCATDGSTRSCRVALAGGRSYAFQVRAFNAAGASKWSVASNAAAVKHPARPPVLASWQQRWETTGGAAIKFAPKYASIPPGTVVRRAELSATRQGSPKVVAAGRTVALPPGAYVLTQRAWFTMSDGRAGMVARSQVVQIVNRTPPPDKRIAFLDQNWRQASPQARSYFCTQFRNDRVGLYVSWVGWLAQSANSTREVMMYVFPFTLYASFYGARC